MLLPSLFARHVQHTYNASVRFVTKIRVHKYDYILYSTNITFITSTAATIVCRVLSTVGSTYGLHPSPQRSLHYVCRALSSLGITSGPHPSPRCKYFRHHGRGRSPLYLYTSYIAVYVPLDATKASGDLETSAYRLRLRPGSFGFRSRGLAVAFSSALVAGCVAGFIPACVDNPALFCFIRQ